MRVVISGMFWSQPTVGTGQYLHGLLGALGRVAPEHEYILLLPAYRSDLRPPTTDHRPTEPPIQNPKSKIQNRIDGPPTTVLVRTPFDQRDKNLAKLWFEQ